MFWKWLEIFIHPPSPDGWKISLRATEYKPAGELQHKHFWSTMFNNVVCENAFTLHFP